MEFSFCHFNDFRNVVEAWTRDPKITKQQVSLAMRMKSNLFYVENSFYDKHEVCQCFLESLLIINIPIRRS